MNKSKLSVRQMCVLALFLAIEIIMYLTPIGYLRINALSVTLMHVPVIILASTMGPAAGAFLGFIFGCTSVIGATMTPGITSFVFSPFITVGGISGNFFSLVIALVPRILLGVVAGYVFKFAKNTQKYSSRCRYCSSCGNRMPHNHGIRIDCYFIRSSILTSFRYQSSCIERCYGWCHRNKYDS